jgi:hypothetical protein
MTFKSSRQGVLLLIASAALACEPERPPNAAPAIAATITTRCASCHEAPKPGVRARAEVAKALSRHHKRVRLTDDQWEAVLEYLAEGSGGTPTQLDR